MYAPPEIHLAFGKPAIIDCHFRSNPPLTNLRWEKDGFLFDPYNVQVSHIHLEIVSIYCRTLKVNLNKKKTYSQGVFYKRNGSIFISSVEDSHAGQYSCTPSNELGTQGPSSLIRVYVQRPPVFTLNPKPIYIHKLGDTVTFQCDAKDQASQRRSVIHWRRKDGTPLPFPRTTIEGINFSIENINETDR